MGFNKFSICMAATGLLWVFAADAASMSTQKPGKLVPAAKVASKAAARGEIRVLLLQDVAPWGTTSNETLLNNLAIPFDLRTSADLATTDLKLYSGIIVASDQPQSFYDAIAAYSTAVGKWLLTGKRTLDFHGADNGFALGHWNFALPGQVTGNMGVFDQVNFVVKPESALVAGLPATITGSAASHDTLNLGNISATSVVVTDSVGTPTLIDYCFGLSRVIASGMTLEYHYQYQNDADKPGKVLENIIAATTATPGCQR